jgi:SAM-dependent methyltransferase
MSDAARAASNAATVPGGTVPVSTVPPNYAYWRESGQYWADEYDRRKRAAPYYHLQELMLTEYIERHAPADGRLRVLEFGCGVGRHLRNLARLARVEVFGYDQSEAMVSGCRRWATPEWIASNIHVGPPTGPLPYPDQSFDIVYTSEVLIHVRPEDLRCVLGELARVARRQLLHIEPAPTTQVCREAHEGCWNHDLIAAYAQLGHRCELLESGYRLQAPYRVALSGQPAFTWSPVTLGIMRRFEQDMLDGLEDARAGR